MKKWESTINIKNSKNKSNLKNNNVIDIYKREILDTRITVSELFSSDKITNKNHINNSENNFNEKDCQF